MCVWILSTGTVGLTPFLSGLMTFLHLYMSPYVTPAHTIFGCFQTLGQRRDLNCCLAYKLRIYIIAIFTTRDTHTLPNWQLSVGTVQTAVAVVVVVVVLLTGHVHTYSFARLFMTIIMIACWFSTYYLICMYVCKCCKCTYANSHETYF